MKRPFCLALLLFCSEHAAGQDEHLPAYIIEVPPSVRTVLVAETETSNLHRFERAADAPVFRDSRYMSIGENGVGKEKAWDRRTPLGIYFVTEQLDTTKLHEKYGVTAYPLDYPNTWDERAGRTGDGIWIHGVDERSGQRPPLDTDGCIALPNDELLALGDDLVPLATPVIIARELEWLPPEAITSLRSEIRAALELWRRSMEAGDLKTYLDLYADDFSYRGMQRDEWLAFRLQASEATHISSVRIDDVLLLADPESSGIFLSRFRHTVVEDGDETRTRKRLYWRREEGGRWRIVAEDNG